MKPFIIGHRGAMAYEPENTILSIKKAIELGSDGVEIDVRRCKSGELIVINNDTVDRTTNGQGYVKDFTLDKLQKLDAGKGEKIPTLEEVINYINNKKIKLIIELKEKDLEKDVLILVEKHNLQNDSIIISFFHQIIKNIKKINKNIDTGLLFVGNPVNVSSLAKEADAIFLFTNFKYTDKDLVDNAHENNLKVYVWNIDDIENLEKMLKLGVDGVGSNKPDVVVDYLNSKNP
ncbi:hypothetical protein CMO83_04810 [Candidatus Woesearchaeota archaeon]|jgi:glycerophosphoryl diester phosphodiesterase|nr:hypothetical protein [Candidatus Woesearchaeota archaeon]MDP6648213.1 glycerophosphodiester phosphodiesterase family protein [Candidatus Woesearchaeota archaeon]|tara:strand:- start:32317 stop:33015 length:699 start_codon:yes stop_codon:yes gene_type:complete